jgi:MOB kinase activator 1
MRALCTDATFSRSRKPTALSAPLYVENLMTWIQNQLDDEKLFPQKIGACFLFPFFLQRVQIVDRLCVGVPFPRNYSTVCRTILRRLFRVYAHIYYEHFDQICALGIEGPFPPPLFVV